MSNAIQTANRINEAIAAGKDVRDGIGGSKVYGAVADKGDVTLFLWRCYDSCIGATSLSG